MSLHPHLIAPVPEETARVARAAFRLPGSNRAKNSAEASILLDTSINSLKTLGIFMWSTDR